MALNYLEKVLCFVPKMTIFSELKAKAKRWESSTITQLKSKRSTLKEQVADLIKKDRMKHELQLKRHQLGTLEARMRMMNKDKELMV